MTERQLVRPLALKTVELHSIEKEANGTLLIKLALRTLQGGDTSLQWHRTSIPPGLDATLQMEAVNTNLVGMGWPRLTPEAIEHVKAVVADNHTVGVVAAFKAEQEAAINRGD